MAPETPQPLSQLQGLGVPRARVGLDRLPSSTSIQEHLFACFYPPRASPLPRWGSAGEGPFGLYPKIPICGVQNLKQPFLSLIIPFIPAFNTSHFQQ